MKSIQLQFDQFTGNCLLNLFLLPIANLLLLSLVVTSLN